MKWIALLLFAFTSALTGTRALAWVDGEVLVWIGGDKGWQGLAKLGKKCEAELGIPVKVEPLDELTDKFQNAAQGGKGPDIVIWAHDRLGEWADAGLIAMSGALVTLPPPATRMSGTVAVRTSLVSFLK